MSAQETDREAALAELPLRKVLSLVGLQTVFFVTVGLALWNLAERPLVAFVALRASDAGMGLGLAAVLIATSAALSKVFPTYTERLVRAQARNYPFLKNRVPLGAILFISLCAGIGEEAFFRGGMQTLLGDVLPMPLAVAIASALFALIHFAQPLNSALIFVIGSLFGVVYWQTGSLLTVMVAHAVYDIYALWALQKAMHELGVFDDESAPLLHAPGARERLDTENERTGETS